MRLKYIMNRLPEPIERVIAKVLIFAMTMMITVGWVLIAAFLFGYYMRYGGGAE